MLIKCAQALAKDLDLGESSYLLDLLTQETATLPTSDTEDAHPSSPEEIPLSRPGTLFLLTHAIFSSTLFSTSHLKLPNLSLFPGFAGILGSFVGVDGPETTGTEDTSIIDALLAIGLWLEENDKFVAGPLSDEDFLTTLQSLSLLSANCPDEKLRFAAHTLTGSIFHAHPSDKVRVTFLSDTLEHCPFEALRASAVGWLKEELITAYQRSSSMSQSPSIDNLDDHHHNHGQPQKNAFATPAAISLLQPYLFPYESALTVDSDEELWSEFQSAYVFHMAALAFLIFLAQWPGSSQVVPEGMMTVVEEVYVKPLKEACGRLAKMLNLSQKTAGEMLSGSGEGAKETGLREVEMLRERIGRLEELVERE